MSTLARALTLLSLTLVVAGCGGYAYSGSASVRAPATVESSASAASAPEPDPRSRPGLATQWGEQRTSRVSMTRFVRGDAAPSAVAVLHYNDASGAAAQATLSGAEPGSHLAFGSGAQRVLVSLIDEYGQPLPAYRVGADPFVVGEPGRRYAIRIDNQSPYRLEAVVSVDGLDVVDGREASFDKRGYILHPGGTTIIDGFRTSTSEVAAFRFGSVASSYAAQTTGSARNVGVVGVALFAEAGAYVDLFDEVRVREQANPFPGQFAAPPPNAVVY